MSFVFQEAFILSDTIYQNIAIGQAGATPEEVEAAAQAAQIHNFIMSLPDGYDTIVGEGGSTLSGGEKQRISIARALIKNAPIVLLDETTSSLDADNADQIIVLDKGKIREKGTHKELLSMNGWYSQVIAEQERVKNWTV